MVLILPNGYVPKMKHGSLVIRGGDLGQVLVSAGLLAPADVDSYADNFNLGNIRIYRSRDLGAGWWWHWTDRPSAAAAGVPQHTLGRIHAVRDLAHLEEAVRLALEFPRAARVPTPPDAEAAARSLRGTIEQVLRQAVAQGMSAGDAALAATTATAMALTDLGEPTRQALERAREFKAQISDHANKAQHAEKLAKARALARDQYHAQASAAQAGHAQATACLVQAEATIEGLRADVATLRDKLRRSREDAGHLCD